MKYHILLIPDNGDTRALRAKWNNAQAAAEHGAAVAKDMFPNERTEVVVIETATRQAVINVFVDDHTAK
jgi:hypothetical protein